jgi:hypothetical protein
MAQFNRSGVFWVGGKYIRFIARVLKHLYFFISN